MKKTSKSRLPSTQQTRKNKFHRTKQAEKAKCSSALVLTAYPGRAEPSASLSTSCCGPAQLTERNKRNTHVVPWYSSRLCFSRCRRLWHPRCGLPGVRCQLSLHPALLSTTASAAVTNPDVLFSSQEAAAAAPAARRTRRCPRHAARTAPRSWRARCAP